MSIALLERFYARVEHGSGCWEWHGYRHPQSGYGQVRADGRISPAHRVSWELTYGQIPEGMLVCHRCDNPPCVRPSHLFLGTQSDNIRDSVAKGRHSSLRQSKPVTTEIWHGTTSGYQTHKCRCERCRAAYAAYMRNYYARNRERYLAQMREREARKRAAA